ncbi:GH25 family lysozyme [Vagococcus fluvialis]|uniref:GH25 family lysozyme n=1 Tax=Vagococcus fluvialis TaxID=2738 RepID=UPI0037D8EE73
MLTVTDLSNHQLGLNIQSVPADAYIFKLSEGTTFKDKAATDFITQVRALNKPFGLYHFLNAEPVTEQAEFFLSLAKEYIGEAILVLDYEEYGKQGAQKAKEFLDYIYQQTKVKPLIYMNESDANSDDWSEVIKSDYGLWVAKYSSNLPNLTQWPEYAMWQYTSSPYDTSYFYGDLMAWYKYAQVETFDNQNYHTSGKRFQALKNLVIKADETFKKDTGMLFSKSTIFDIESICHTETTTHGRLYYNHSKVFITLHKDYVDKID